MYSSQPFPGQSSQMFKDKFCKWPKLMRLLVLLNLLPTIVIVFVVHQQLAPFSMLDEVLAVTAGFNGLLLLWGVLLKIRSKKYWYRNYHIGKTMAVALLPVLASGYLFISQPTMPDMAQQQESKAVYISLN
ncbi:hypothetical protein [Photobacterium atrarenae]|uniref:Uncharacterized protein n=1 Tax=Photobacterium atrarenae TaxID=865757 RepID=A0ABY5GK03_9GAMM|nr:hypothetical protein [Photobacterium atrarenae]UTV28887.1 hypothetical protein NNL38_06550 [Photobacterium atrarenae]